METKVESLQDENQELRICISELVSNGPKKQSTSFIPRISESEKQFEANKEMDFQMN
jgi:hypothetical protein